MAVHHSTTIRQLGEGAVQAVCSCGWRSAVFGAGKTTGTMDPLQHAPRIITTSWSSRWTPGWAWQPERGDRLLTGITYQGGHLSGLDALDYVSWGRWVTLLFQVMPVFFLVGGYANAVSWTAQ